MIIKRWLLAVAALIFCGCSTTPGDAAYRGGHLTAAANLYHRGAELGDALAALKLGLMIDDREVAENTYGSAGIWHIKSCQLGNDVGCHNAGVGFEYGSAGLTKDYDEARVYYLRAAEHGYMSSQYNLGTLYANEYFSDDVVGLKWLLIAQASARSCAGNELCKWILDDPPGHIERLRKRMSSKQIAEAEDAASTWRPSRAKR